MLRLYGAFKLKAGNNAPIWYGWYPQHITVVNNTGGAWGTSSTIKDNDGVSDPSLCTIFIAFLTNLKFRLAKKPEKQRKNRYFDVIANFECYISNLKSFCLNLWMFLQGRDV